MMPSTRVPNRTKRGRPRVDTAPVTLRFGRADIKEIDDWRRVDPDLPSRTEAIRRLVKRGLIVKWKGRKSLRPNQLNAENDG